MLRVWGRCLKRGLQVRCRRVDTGGKEVWSLGALEAHARRRDVEVFASRDRELGRCAGSVLPLCLKRSGALEAYCGCRDV